MVENNDTGSASVQLPHVRTWDLFDTLIARRVGVPHRILYAIEEHLKFPGFAKLRIEAEASVSHSSEYTLSDIYLAMSASFGLSISAAVQLQRAELAEELKGLIPIREHIEKIAASDIIITDTYFPKAFIETVVREKCGLPFNRVYFSARGKLSGAVWIAMARAFRVIEHTGDNEHSDYLVPLEHGIKACLVTTSKATEDELLVEELGFGSLARAMREGRLETWSPDSVKRELGLAQIGVNFPLLFLSALLLIELSLRKGWQNLLFSSRDCFLFLQVFRKIVSRLDIDIKSEYFFTSRIARAAPSVSYKRYFDSLCSAGKTAVIDICGTGWSLTRLFEAVGKPDTDMFVIHHLDYANVLSEYENIGRIHRKPAVHFLVKEGNGGILEALNAADHKMVSDVIEVDGFFIPIFVDETALPRYSELVRFSTQAFDCALASSDHVSDEEMIGYLARVSAAHVDKLYAAMGKFSHAVAEIGAQNGAENEPVMAYLRQRLQRSAN